MWTTLKLSISYSEFYTTFYYHFSFINAIIEKVLHILTSIIIYNMKFF